jgi:ketosteroid isomerase-like protein
VHDVTTNEARASILARALQAGLDNDRATVEALCTEDVRVWAPAITARSRAELLDALDRRDAAFSDVELTTAALDVGGDFACIEWTVRMTHTGVIDLGDGTHVDATGERVVVNGATIAEFDGERICSLRQYWDEFAVLEQLGVRPAEAG